MSTRLIAAALAACLAPPAARAADDDNPYKTAKVGDYVVYKIEGKIAGKISSSGTITHTITGKTEKEVTYKISAKTTANGKTTETPDGKEHKIDLTKPYHPINLDELKLLTGPGATVEKGKEGKEKVKVAGREYDTTWSTFTVKAKGIGGKTQDIETKTWLSRGVPLGLVRTTTTFDLMGQKVETTTEFSEAGNKK